LMKPFDQGELLAALDNAAPRGTRLLVVDDDPQIPDLVRQLLDGDAYAVEAVFDGECALDAARQRIPDVVLLDLLMPRLDGFGVLDAMRRDDLLRDVPVVVLTAKALTVRERAQLRKRVRSVIDKAALDRETLMRELKQVLPRGIAAKADP
ncbi:MAG TPA: response regulator, partial [Alphaproteobacteria bacterium]|nr:response regulator [Alphaproteobacteria bacterium]